jgi:catechol 2,3-dioxygenase-like lactoylglutathione lyase family enzyme
MLRVMEFVALHHVQVAMPAGQEDRAEAFYAGVLGLERVDKPTVLADRGGCWFRQGPVELHLGVEDPFGPARKAHPGLLVDDLEAVRRRLEAAGAEIVDAPGFGGFHRFHTFDPFGNRLELMEREG